MVGSQCSSAVSNKQKLTKRSSTRKTLKKYLHSSATELPGRSKINQKDVKKLLVFQMNCGCWYNKVYFASSCNKNSWQEDGRKKQRIAVEKFPSSSNLRSHLRERFCDLFLQFMKTFWRRILLMQTTIVNKRCKLFPG